MFKRRAFLHWWACFRDITLHQVIDKNVCTGILEKGWISWNSLKPRITRVIWCELSTASSLEYFWHYFALSSDANSAEYQQVIYNCPFACSAVTYWFTIVSRGYDRWRWSGRRWLRRRAVSRSWRTCAIANLYRSACLFPCIIWISSPL